MNLERDVCIFLTDSGCLPKEVGVTVGPFPFVKSGKAGKPPALIKTGENMSPWGMFWKRICFTDSDEFGIKYEYTDSI